MSAWNYPKDEVRAVLRLDTANVLDNVRFEPSNGPQSRLSGRWVATNLWRR